MLPLACDPVFPTANDGSEVVAGRAGPSRQLTICLVGMVEIGGVIRPALVNCHVLRGGVMHDVTCRDVPRR
jgi:hypothetical protein